MGKLSSRAVRKRRCATLPTGPRSRRVAREPLQVPLKQAVCRAGGVARVLAPWGQEAPLGVGD